MIRILYIEDDLMVGKSTYQLFQHEKFEIDWAKTGLEALDYLFGQTYHIVLLDLGLPELEGMEVLKHIRKQVDMNKMGVIIISARDQSRDKIQGLRLGYIIMGSKIAHSLAESSIFFFPFMTRCVFGKS